MEHSYTCFPPFEVDVEAVPKVFQVLLIDLQNSEDIEAKFLNASIL
jgi:hypothetical protein